MLLHLSQVLQQDTLLGKLKVSLEALCIIIQHLMASILSTHQTFTALAVANDMMIACPSSARLCFMTGRVAWVACLQIKHSTRAPRKRFMQYKEASTFLEPTCSEHAPDNKHRMHRNLKYKKFAHQTCLAFSLCRKRSKSRHGT